MEDVIIGFKTLVHPDIHHIDSYTAPTPWNQNLFDKGYNKQVVLGVPDEFADTPLAPSVKRAMDLAVQAAETKGFKIVRFKIPE